MSHPIHLPRLDGLRGLAAVGVLIFHLRLIYDTINPLEGVPGAVWIQHSGWLLVDLFFVLSGFVFAYRYLDDGRLRAGVTLTDFAWARFARLWPLYAVALLFAAFVLHERDSTTIENFAMSAAFLHVFIDGENVLNAPAWSISVEVICYILFAVIAMIGRSLMRLAVPALICAGALLVSSDPGLGSQIGRGLLGFFAGVAISQMRERLETIHPVILALPASLSFFVPSEGAGLVLITLMGWTSVVLLSLKAKFLETQPMRWLGDRSYAIYIIHFPVLVLADNVSHAIGARDLAGIIGTTIVSLAVVLFLSNFSYNSIERPAQKALLRTRFSKAFAPESKAAQR